MGRYFYRVLIGCSIYVSALLYYSASNKCQYESLTGRLSMQGYHLIQVGIISCICKFLLLNSYYSSPGSSPKFNAESSTALSLNTVYQECRRITMQSSHYLATTTLLDFQDSLK